MTEESKIQKKIITFLESKGRYCLKISRTNRNGTPDVLSIHPNQTNIWVEVKTTVGIQSPLQRLREAELKALGQVVIVAYGYKDFLDKYEEARI